MSNASLYWLSNVELTLDARETHPRCDMHQQTLANSPNHGISSRPLPVTEYCEWYSPDTYDLVNDSSSC